MSDPLAPANVTFVIEGQVNVMISITELGDGTLKLEAKVLDETGEIGDLRGLFFDVADESLISGLRITGSGITGTQFSEDGVSNLGSGNNVNGSIINEYGKFDIGVAFGTAGIGKDDIREASFILSHVTADLTYDFLSAQDFAVRLTSVGSEGGSRDDSLKLGGTSPESGPELGSIGDTVFLDADGDGLRDADEAGVANVTVSLKDADGNVIATTVTDSNGKYLFGNLAAGAYSVAVTAPAGLGFTARDAGDDALDSDVDPATGMTALISLSEGEHNLSVDIGLVQLNDPPVAVDDAVATDEGVAVSLALLANDSDPDGDALTLVSAGGQAPGTSFAVTSAGGRSGSVTVGANGVLAFDPGSAFDDLGVGQSDTVAVAYEISDGKGGTATATATITVNGLNDGPVALDDAAETDEDTPVSVALLANDSDPDGDPLTVTSVNGHAAGSTFAVTSAGGRTGTASFSPDGTLVFDPAGNFEDLGSNDLDFVSVLYQIADGQGGTATARATVLVHGLNDAPDAVDDFYTLPETGTALLDILANDSDPEGDPLTVTLLSQPLEGTISLEADGTVTFDPGTDFLGLSEGQTATVTFDYQISDGELTDTATVTIKVLGQGVFEPCTTTESAVVAVGGRPVTTTVEADCSTNDGTADLRFRVSLGDTAQSKYNVIYVIDVSGSTGVAGSFGDTTVLDAQIAALQDLTAEFMSVGLPADALTITVLPFNSRALPTEPIQGQTYPRVIFGDDEALSATDVDAALANLEAGGETNYVAAVFAATGTIQQLEAQRGDAINLVYFLSDGNPFPANSQPVSLLTQASATLKAQASVHGVALGELIDPQYVNAIDNTGGAQLITDDPAALNAALHEAPVAPGIILGANLTVYNSQGGVIDTFHFTGTDFVETPLGFELNVENVSGLDVHAGQTNKAELTIDFDHNGDLIADSSTSLDVEITGVLPHSYDA